MIRFLNSKRGFSLTEIIGGALIVIIAAAGTFSAYLLARQFSDKFNHRTMAWNCAARIADDLRFTMKFAQLVNGTTTVYNSGSDIWDIRNWRLTQEVIPSDPGYVTVDVKDVWFDDNGVETTTDTGRPEFKKIVVKIKYKERKPAG